MSEPARAWATITPYGSLLSPSEGYVRKDHEQNVAAKIPSRIVELVEVVRCGQCRYWERTESGVGLCVCPHAPYKSALAGDEDWFCADGRRREVSGG